MDVELVEGDDLGPVAFQFCSPYLPGFRIEGRSVEFAPPNNTVAPMYRRNEAGYQRAGIGRFKDGRWLRGTTQNPYTTEGLFWVRMVNVAK